MPPPPKKHEPSSNKTNKTNKANLQIIGGQYNGKKIYFSPPLRPSGGRVRESLFSCLGQQLHPHICLDLFAGTGALGLSALSRYAKKVVFVEKQKTLADNIQKITQTWGADATVINTSAHLFLKTNTQRFSLVFLDPPFSDYQNNSDWHQLLHSLPPHLTPDATIYCESDKFFTLPDNAQLITQRKIGQVHWQLITLSANRKQ